MFNYVYRLKSLAIDFCILPFKKTVVYFVNVLESVSVEKSYCAVATAIVKFWEIKENINQGLSFYIALQVVNYTCSLFF